MSLLSAAKARTSTSGWRLLASALDPRLLLVLLFLICFTLPVFIAKPAQWFDQQLFTFGAWLKPANIDTDTYVRVNLPDDEINKLLRDPLQAKKSLNFLNELQQTATVSSLLLLPSPLWPDYRTNELLRLHAPLFQAAAPAAVGQQLSELNQSLRHYTALMGNTQLLKAYHAPEQNHSTSLLALLMNSSSFTSLYPLKEGLEAGYPLYTDQSFARPLLWASPQGAWPDARLALIMAKFGTTQIQWKPQQGVSLQGRHLLSTAPNSSLIPLYSRDSGKSFAIKQYQLDEFSGSDVRRTLQQKIVVVASASDPYADDLLLTVASIVAGEYLTFSPWFMALHCVIMLALLCYLLLVFTISTRLALVLSAALALGLVILQQSMLLLERDWLPIGHFLLFLLVGHTLMFLIIVRRRFYTAMDFEKTMTLMAAANTRTAMAKRVPAERREPVLAQANPAHVASGGRRIGRYEIIRELGRGAMGVVYLGYDPGISRYVAIKTLKIDADNSEEAHLIFQRFKAEAGAAGGLSHPNIVTIFEFGESDDGSAFIAMDFVDGAPLSANTKPDTLLDAKVVCWLMAQVADAVWAAHKNDIVHRDIKPSNILFDPKKGEVKVADFGIAKALNAGQTRTRTGDILGSPLYMSPEQISGQPATPASDIFSMGVTLYQLLTGELPFKGDNIATLSMQIVKHKPRDLKEFRSDLPRGLQSILNACLHKKPEKRFATAQALADALKKLLQSNNFQ